MGFLIEGLPRSSELNRVSICSPKRDNFCSGWRGRVHNNTVGCTSGSHALYFIKQMFDGDTK